MNEFKNRVLTFFLLGILLVFILLALIMGNIVHHSVKEKRMQFYAGELGLIEQVLNTEEEPSTIKSLLQYAAKDLNGEIYVLDSNWNVKYTSDGNSPRNMSSYYPKKQSSDNELVQKNESGKIYYTLERKQKENTGYIQLAVPEGAAEDAERSIWIMMSIGFLICFVIILYVSLKVIHKIVRPVEEATQTAKELAKGNFKARTYEYYGEDIGELNYSLNVLARNLEKMTKSQESQHDRLITLIENMGSGLILIDSNGYINLVNKAFKELFKEHADYWTGHLFYEVFPHAEIKDIVKETYLTEKNVKKNVVIPIHIERKHFDVYSAPVLDVKGKLRGIVLVFHDITELKKLEQVRKDFVANVSHELKTPITSLKGFAETLLDGAGENEEYRNKFLTIILNESDRLQALIQDLLDLSKSEQGFHLDLQKVNLEDLVKETIEILLPKAEKKNITLSLSVSGNPMMDGDAPRLKQIIINLVSNSLNYTPADGSIFVHVEEKKEHVKLTVNDTGIGIKESEIPRIFERFYRVDKARSRNSGGTGLGLAIVKHLVEAHHGTIKVESKVGEGSRFILRFPKKLEL
ncbi:two-component system histidine kinase PnpS [Fictibacillus sp. BK138]|jgi:two-component system, OmpR family, phosphate regulon sensor histidine kinase PhoR|uniref:two-component system histidine kinase PnpS n=1 Tax=Fictibacillus sp. BK138 TaxID=2512121 RepID=UPI001029D359|nr:HAMP domain-containing sensor histidine kinase [Fictibacillus sp. BK138]RZT22082.1 PAS/PAC sensor signal transduction histidine kinase [Fictibacillus sp. BK138]